MSDENDDYNITTSDGTTYIGTWGPVIAGDGIQVTLDNIDNLLAPTKCTKCEKIGPIAHSYSGPKISRNICQKCYNKIMDKLYDLNINSEVEDLLYEE